MTRRHVKRHFGHFGKRRQHSRRLRRTACNQRLRDIRPSKNAAPKELPPSPPLALTPVVACDPDTDMEILWHIAREVPELRRWLVANPAADAELLEYISQAGGPGVKHALQVLLRSIDDFEQQH